MATDAKIQSLSLMPDTLNRNKSQNRLEPNEARVLQNADVLWMEGRLRRAQGFARTDWPKQSVTPMNAYALTRNDCKIGIIWHDTAGNVKVCFQSNTVGCVGPLPLWNDNDPTTQQMDNNGGTGANMIEEPPIDQEGDY